MKKKRSFLDGLIDTLSATAAAELSERLPISGKAKATARRHMRKQLRDSMRDGAEAAGNAAKKVKEKVASAKKPTLEDSITSLQFHTSCAVLGLGEQKYGKPVSEALIRDSKRAAAKMFHPDVAGDNSREQFQAVVEASKWLEKYNESLSKK